MHNAGELRRIKEQFPDELAVIGVHSAKFPSERVTENIREAARRYGIEHPVVNDAGFQVWEAYGVRAWPTVVLIGPQGKILQEEAGEIDAQEWIHKLGKFITEADEVGTLDRRPLEISADQPDQPASLLRFPSRLAFAQDGRFFIADTGHHRILEMRMASPQKAEVKLVYGAGEAGFLDGTEAEALFNSPRGIAVYEDTLYVADTGNHAIRAIDLTSTQVRTIAGRGEKGRGRYTPGKPTETALRSPWAILPLPSDQAGEKPYLFIAMAGSHQIWLIINEEKIGVFAGNGREALVDGPLASSSFNQPSDLAFGFGHLLVADPEASAIRAIALGSEPGVFTLVGQGLFEFGDVDGSGPQIRLQHAAGLAFHDGLVYIADTYNNKIKTLDPTTGEVKTLVGDGEPGSQDGSFTVARLYEPEGLAVYQGRIYIADTNNHLVRVADLQTGQVSTLEITGLENIASAPALRLPETVRLQPVSVPAGQAQLNFDIQIPEGYKLNPEAPISLSLGGQVFTFNYGQPIEINLQLEHDTEIPLGLTLFYCQTEDARLCLIHDRRLVLPVHVAEDADAQATISYSF